MFGPSATLLAPDRPTLTGAALRTQIQEIAASLGDSQPVTAVLLPQGPDLFTAILGAMLAGTAAPIDPQLPAPEIAAHLVNIRPDFVISSSGLARVSTTPRRNLPPDTRLLLQTSATTGRPKLVPLSTANLQASIANQLRCFALTSTDRFLSFGPLFHLHALGSALAQLAAGGSVICVPAFDPLAFPNWLDQFRPTWYTGAPVVHRAILSLIDSGVELPTRSLRFVRSSSAALDPATQESLERALGVPLLNSYGSTEAGTITAAPLSPRDRKPGSAGIGVGPEIRILAPDGEIAIRGPNVFAGYLDADGHLFITGRRNDVINRGGVKITSTEVKAALMSHPDVVEAVTFGVPHARLGEDIVAVVVPRDGSQITPATLTRHASAHLAPAKVPRRIAFTTALPLNAAGKPHRPALLALLEHPEPKTASPEAALAPAALTPNESRIASVWSRVLGLASIGATDNLWSLGSDSLSTAVILSEVESALGRPPSLEAFFAEPTVRNLAAAYQSTRGDHAGLIHLQGRGTLPPLYCIAADTGDPYYLRHLAQHLHGERPVYLVPRPELAEPTVPEPTVEDFASPIANLIRTAAADRAFLLAGHCLGGVVAFETARRLRACGASLQLLVLFDSPTPGYPRIAAQRYVGAATSLARESGLRALLREVPRHLRHLLRNRSRTAPTAPPARRTLHSYQPLPLDCPIVQVLASEHRATTRVADDERLGWRDFAPAGFRTLHAIGDHNSILLPPTVQSLAAELETIFPR